MNTSLARKLLNAMLAVASVGACLLVMDTPRLRPEAPGPVGSNVLALKHILMAEVPTPWPQALGHLTNDAVGVEYSPTEPLLMSDSPTPWPQMTNGSNV